MPPNTSALHRAARASGVILAGLTVVSAAVEPGDGVFLLDAPPDPTSSRNLAYIGNGAAKATASSALQGFDQHRPETVNDGVFGNASSWICAQDDAAPWLKIDIGREVSVSHVAFGRDRRGEFQDRLPTRVTLSESRDGTAWRPRAAIADLTRLPGYAAGRTVVIRFPPTICRFLKIEVNPGSCMDEFAVYSAAPIGSDNAPPRIEPVTAEQAPLFRKTGTDQPEDFTDLSGTRRFEVVNPGSTHLLVLFAAHPQVRWSPGVLRLAPGGRLPAQLTVVKAAAAGRIPLTYAIARSDQPFTSHGDRYRAGVDGETVQCVPVAPMLHASLLSRTRSILKDSLEKVTDPQMPAGTMIYTPGPYYRSAGIFARDLLYQLEGAGRFTVPADEVRHAVDFLALKQLTADRKVGAYTYPKGAIPDHVYPDGRYSWGPGLFYGDVTGHFRRPSMDEAMCFVTLAWHYGSKAGWDAAWKAWFHAKAARFADAWNSVPRNPATGLVTQWTTPGHVGANGIAEINGACVMWGFHDSYGFGGDDVGVSVLACNAARALADMHGHAGDAASATTWATTADAMRDAIRAQFNPAGYLPWGVGKAAPTMASPDITGYAVWSGILTDTQADAASDWFAERYRADLQAGGAADLFHQSAPFRGAVRMARKADDVSPGRHVWPDMRDGNHWENLAFGYNAYQDGGYWYYMSLGVAAALQRRHPDLAQDWVGKAYHDLHIAGPDHPFERIDGMKPVNNRYNASVGPLMGMGLPAQTGSIAITLRP